MGRPQGRTEEALFFDRVMAGLYTDHLLTMKEIGEIFGISRQRVQQRLVETGVECRSRGRPNWRTVPPWQRKYLRRLASYGLPSGEAHNVLSMRWDHDVAFSCSARGYGPSLPGVRGFLQKIAMEVGNLVLEKAWADGATLKDLAEIFGTSVESIAIKVHRSRAQGYNLPYRDTYPRQRKAQDD